MARSLNRAQLIGNLTRDPELRYTPNGTAVCSFGLATNRSWKTETGEKREEADFHNIVAWNKLAELCSQFLVKGRKVYVEGRLSTRSWTGQDGTQKTRTEIVISDMILLDSRRPEGSTATPEPEVREEQKVSEPQTAETPATTASDAATTEAQSREAASDAANAGSGSARKKTEAQKKDKPGTSDKTKSQEPSVDEVAPDDIPF